MYTSLEPMLAFVVGILILLVPGFLGLMAK